MERQETFVAVTDWLVIFAVAVVLLAVYASWLTSYRTPKVAPVGTNLWFALPVWAQIAVGFAISVLGAYVGYLLWTPLPVMAAPGVALLLRLVGLVLVGGGATLWFWARWALGAMMGISTASAAQLQLHHRLIQHGPYALVRHPMYLGYWLVLVGLFIMYRTWTPLVILILLVVSLSRRARREDLVLEVAFGEAWRKYAERVPPFIPRQQ